MHNKKMFIFLITSLFFLKISLSQNYKQVNDFFPGNGCVPDTTTAIKIAEAVWLPIYGNKIYDEQPFKAVLVNDSIWHVFGTLPPSKTKVDSNGYATIYYTLGGVANIYLLKSNGKILRVIHTK